MRIVYLGTPKEVISPLKQLVTMSEHEIIAVVSQPAKPQGRKRLLEDPPVAKFAKEQNIPLLQPISARDANFIESLRELNPDLMITAAYGQILSEEFLSLPKMGTINLHPSLLPSYRGATPVQTALLDGQSATGMTILFTVEKLDAGDIILQRKSSIQPDETTESLLPRMFDLGARMLPEALTLIEDPNFVGQPQDESAVTHCKKIQKEDGAIDWNTPCESIYNKFRAFSPWPGSYTFLNNKRIVITQMSLTEVSDSLEAPGTFYLDKKQNKLTISCQNGLLSIHMVKPAGAKEQDARAFWNGLKIEGKGHFHDQA